MCPLSSSAQPAPCDGLEDKRPESFAQRRQALRQSLQAQNLRGFLVPRADEHQGEYVPRRAERLAWISGFTGSAGLAAILDDQACLFTDGRYTLQAQAEIDGQTFLIRHIVNESLEAWLPEVLNAGDRLGYDPMLHTPQAVKRLEAACKKRGASAVPCPHNLIDQIWDNQAPPPMTVATPHPLSLTGQSAADKRQAVGASLVQQGADYAFLSAPDSIAWLLNIRGDDLPHIPVVLAFAVISQKGAVTLFIDAQKIPQETQNHLGPEVILCPPDQMAASLQTLGTEEAPVTLLVDPSQAPVWVQNHCDRKKVRILAGDDPCSRPKACKNLIEIAGTKAAHRRDGVALTRFLAWLDKEGTTETVSELDAVAKLRAFRAEDPLFWQDSFSTIAGSGPHGAIVHYRVSEETNRILRSGELFLLDSGGQYPDGTTDVTRTVCIGTPSPEHQDRFTRVLQGHIALATACFPEGTSGSQLDCLARAPLWQVGLDYDHGTGHGVGSYLSVHEGPQRISKAPQKTALQPGMIVSNEPGYYKTGAFGIRIENLVLVQPVPEERQAEGAERACLCFETLTLAPMDRRLILPSLLSAAERAWVDGYHQGVWQALAPELERIGDLETKAWLQKATAPIDSALEAR